MKTTLIVIVALVALVASLLAARSYLSRGNPPSLGADVDGALKACADRPNCVSSQASDDAHRVDAFAYIGDRANTQARLGAILAGMPRMHAVTQSDQYWHYTQTSALFRFIDDVEFFFDDAAGAVRLRSASRIGYSDMGVNRKRIEGLRAELQAP